MEGGGTQSRGTNKKSVRNHQQRWGTLNKKSVRNHQQRWGTLAAALTCVLASFLRSKTDATPPHAAAMEYPFSEKATDEMLPAPERKLRERGL
jgi:hypothetical protein